MLHTPSKPPLTSETHVYLPMTLPPPLVFPKHEHTYRDIDFFPHSRIHTHTHTHNLPMARSTCSLGAAAMQMSGGVGEGRRRRWRRRRKSMAGNWVRDSHIRHREDFTFACIYVIRQAQGMPAGRRKAEEMECGGGRNQCKTLLAFRSRLRNLVTFKFRAFLLINYY